MKNVLLAVLYMGLMIGGMNLIEYVFMNFVY